MKLNSVIQDINCPQQVLLKNTIVMTGTSFFKLLINDLLMFIPQNPLSQCDRHNWSTYPIAISPNLLIPCSLFTEAMKKQKPSLSASLVASSG